MTNEKTIKAFINRTMQQAKSSTGALSFRGNKIYSYNLLIGEYVDRSAEGFCGLLIHDHTRNGLGFISMTTSQHVGLLKRMTEYHPRMFASAEEGINNLFNQR
tara:strand:+ start:166 stop:474 length:309 start_codon:yes stop_codon:yes gene_type:complete